jgi:hypothetical protein
VVSCQNNLENFAPGNIMGTIVNSPRTKMPRDLKLFLTALVVIPALLITALLALFLDLQNDNIVNDLELNRFKMTISIQEKYSGLRGEENYLKLTLSREEADKLRKWLQRYQQFATSSTFYLPDELEGKPDWQPTKIKTGKRGYFFVKGSYHWRTSYLIAPIDKNTFVFYLYAIDLFYEDDPLPPSN